MASGRFTKGYESLHSTGTLRRPKARKSAPVPGSSLSASTQHLVLKMGKSAKLTKSQMQALQDSLAQVEGAHRPSMSLATAGATASRRSLQLTATSASVRHAAVRVPKVGKGSSRRSHTSLPTSIPYRPMRKPKAASERDIADIDFDRQAERRRMRAPNASRFKYIGASQKTVLQDAYLKEAVAEKAAMKKRAAAAAASGVGAGGGVVDEASAKAAAATMDHDQLFRAVEAEIKERQDFLKEMRQMGVAAQYESKINGEISQRVAELKRLHSLMMKAS